MLLLVAGCFGFTELACWESPWRAGFPLSCLVGFWSPVTYPSRTDLAAHLGPAPYPAWAQTLKGWNHCPNGSSEREVDPLEVHNLGDPPLHMKCIGEHAILLHTSWPSCYLGFCPQLLSPDSPLKLCVPRWVHIVYTLWHRTPCKMMLKALA